MQFHAHFRDSGELSEKKVSKSQLFDPFRKWVASRLDCAGFVALILPRLSVEHAMDQEL